MENEKTTEEISEEKLMQTEKLYAEARYLQQTRFSSGSLLPANPILGDCSSLAPKLEISANGPGLRITTTGLPSRISLEIGQQTIFNFVEMVRNGEVKKGDKLRLEITLL